MISFQLLGELAQNRLTCTVLGPGQAPGTNLPEQVSAVFIHMPLPELVLQVLDTQHWTLVGSFGQ